MMSRNVFWKLGGYDEEFLPSGCQDFDLVARAIVASPKNTCLWFTNAQQTGGSIDNVPGQEWNVCIKEKVANVDKMRYGNLRWGQMNNANWAMMDAGSKEGRIQRNDKKTIGVPRILIVIPSGTKNDEPTMASIMDPQGGRRCC